MIHADFGGQLTRDAHTCRMEETPATATQHLSRKTIWTWLIVMTVVPFIMLAIIISLMVTLNWNFLDWME